MAAPILTTDRLILRPHALTDFAACRTLWADPDVVRHIGGAPQDAQAVWFRILRYAGMWAMLGHGMWVIEERASGAFLGEAGLLSACRELPELEGVVEAGWVLTPGAWGRGIATEAMTAVLGWADDALAGQAVRCIIEVGNDASVAVAAKLGFAAMAQTALNGAPIQVLERRAGRSGG